MNILIEVGLNVEGKRGLDAYFEGLIQGLAETDPRNLYTLFACFFRDYERKRRLLPQPPAPNFRLRVPRWPESAVAALERWGVPVVDALVAGPARCDVYHGVGWLPRVRRARTVVTICDLLYEVFAERAAKEGRDPGFAVTGRTGEAARRADHVITISRCTKDDLVRFYGIDPGKVTPILLGVDHRVFRPTEDRAALDAARRAYGLPERYVLFMGPFEPRRNAEAGLKALAALRGEGVGADCGLVFVGRPNAHLESLRRLSRELGLERDARELGYVPREDLPRVYQQALVFVHPEIYDGFSLPVLEAMACGTPVVTSSTSALPEIVGEAALAVEPEDGRAVTEALRAALTRPELRAELAAKGRARAARFTWRSTAEQTLRVYEELGAARG